MQLNQGAYHNREVLDEISKAIFLQKKTRQTSQVQDELNTSIQKDAQKKLLEYQRHNGQVNSPFEKVRRKHT